MAVEVAVEAAVATVDHSDIRGSEPHNRDPSGAASDERRGFGSKAYSTYPHQIAVCGLRVDQLLGKAAFTDSR